MNSVQREDWQFEAILQILLALAENEHIQKYLIFKGALILNRRLHTPRKSLDIDSNLAADFVAAHPRQEKQISFLKENLEDAIAHHFERQEPVRFKLTKLKIKPSPQTAHPRGWDGFSITVSLLDYENSGVRGLPPLTIDMVAPEVYSKFSYSELQLGQSKILAYSLERIAGEKARAFLMSLRKYRDKVGKPEKATRVKDLYDLVRIARVKILSKATFWNTAGSEFKLSCESRFVDCLGVSSFQEEWPLTEELYRNSPTIPKDVPFEEVETFIPAISKYWEQIGIIPFSFPLTALSARR